MKSYLDINGIEFLRVFNLYRPSFGQGLLWQSLTETGFSVSLQSEDNSCVTLFKQWTNRVCSPRSQVTEHWKEKN